MSSRVSFVSRRKVKRAEPDRPPRRSYTTKKRANNQRAAQLAARADETHYVDYKMVDQNIRVVSSLASWNSGLCFQRPWYTNGIIGGVGPGNGINQRSGNQINVLKLRVRCILSVPHQTWTWAGNQPDDGCIIRVALVQDKQTVGQNLGSPTDIFAPVDGIDQTSTSCLDNQNVASLGRFRVLKDKIFRFDNMVMTAPGGGTDMYQSGGKLSFTWNIKFRKPVSIQYKGSDNTYASILDNAFHIVAVCDNGDLSPAIKTSVRMYYKP